MNNNEIEIFTLERTKEFVDSAMVRVGWTVDPGRLLGVKCIDGRNKPDIGATKQQPQIAGGNVGMDGIFMAALNKYCIEFGKKPDTYVSAEKVVEFGSRMLKTGEEFCCHTDEKNKDEEFICKGCAHAAQMVNNPDSFGLTEKQAKDIKDILAFNNKKKFNPTPLVGGHQESALGLVVASNGFTINSQADIDGKKCQMFVSDRETNLAVLEGITPALQNNFANHLDMSNFNSGYLVDMAAKHLATTGRYVVSHIPHLKNSQEGLPVMLISFTPSGVATVESGGFIKANQAAGYHA